MKYALTLSTALITACGAQPSTIQTSTDQTSTPQVSIPQCVKLYKDSESNPTLFQQAPKPCQDLFEKTIMISLNKNLNEMNTKFGFPSYLTQAYVMTATTIANQSTKELDSVNQQLFNMLERKEPPLELAQTVSTQPSAIDRHKICTDTQTEYLVWSARQHFSWDQTERNIEKRLPHLAQSQEYLDFQIRLEEVIATQMKEAREYSCK